MYRTRRLMSIGFSFIFVVTISLSCNLPLPFITAWYGDQGKSDNEEFKRDIVGTTDATIVSSEGEIIGLRPLEGKVWNCIDVEGEYSFFTNPDNLINGQVVKKAELDIGFRNSGEDEGISVWLQANYDKDVPVIDGVTNDIIAWDHTKTIKDGAGHRMMLWENGVFTGTMYIAETREISYPEVITSKLELQNNVFGLINPYNSNQAFFCDLSRNPIPENLDGLTAENFKDRCLLYFYECNSK